MSVTARLGLREKFSYGLGDFASNLYWAAFGHFLFKFYTDVFGITAAVAGAIFLWSRVWDAINDPMVGALADRTRSRWGKFRPWVLFGAVPLAASGVLAFTTPDLGMTGRIVWAVATYNLVMMLYTVVNIPYSAMLGVISSDSAERTSVSSVKFLLAFAGGMFVKATLPAMTTGLGGGDLKLGFQLTFVIYGIIATLMFLMCFKETKERVEPPPAQQGNFWRDMADLFTSAPWLILLAVKLPFIFYASMRGTIGAHYFDYFIGTQTVWLPFLGAREYTYTSLFPAFGITSDIGSLLGVLLVAAIARKVSKKVAFIAMLSVSIVTTACIYWLTPGQVSLLFGLNFIGSITSGPLSVLLWAMLADTADYGEWKNGRRATGLVFAAQSLTGKFSWALAGFYAGRILQSTGYVPNEAQKPEVLEGMKSMMSLLPASVGLVALLIMIFYPLSEAKVRQIEQDLRARRGTT
jgi:GPH family glycoside/pentoside/hexuronide:cation symporter